MDSFALWMRLLTGPNSTTSEHHRLMKRASLVPPVVEKRWFDILNLRDGFSKHPVNSFPSVLKGKALCSQEISEFSANSLIMPLALFSISWPEVAGL